ncbi:MAG: AC76 family protein [Bacilli bacterium]|nr:AC76 family protein [Bacilli bacterium]MDD4607983.1 AC76 family protein [Bacilli bacterium]
MSGKTKFIIIILTIITMFLISLWYINTHQDTDDIKDKPERKVVVSKEQIEDKIVSIIEKNQEYVDSLGDNKQAIRSFLLKKAKNQLPSGVSAFEIREVIDSILKGESDGT